MIVEICQELRHLSACKKPHEAGSRIYTVPSISMKASAVKGEAAKRPTDGARAEQTGTEGCNNKTTTAITKIKMEKCLLRLQLPLATLQVATVWRTDLQVAT